MTENKMDQAHFYAWLRALQWYLLLLSIFSKLKSSIQKYRTIVSDFVLICHRITKIILGIFFLFACFRLSAEKIVVEYFFQPGCEECECVNAFVLPKLKEKFSGQYKLLHYDIGQLENYRLLLRLQEKLNITSNDSVCMILNRTTYLGGLKDIESKLHSELSQALLIGHKSVGIIDEKQALEARIKKMTIGGIMLAGLIDGINPCVFSTLVFFLSLLSLMRHSKQKIFLVGCVYCFACFIAYVGIGLGIFRFILLFSGYHIIRNIVEYLLCAVLMFLAFYSFRDAWMFKHTQNPKMVVLQLPHKIKQQIHNIMRSGLKYRYLLPGVFVIGVFVTILESVCSGQVYLPTLVLLAREGSETGLWISLLLLYNVMFIMPLIVLFVLATKGVSMFNFIELSKRNVILGKCLMGVLFVAMALLLLFLNIR